MAPDPAISPTHGATAQAALALHRFGLGPRPGSIAAIASDPRGALLAEIERPGIGRIDDRELLSSAESARAAFEARARRQAQQIVAERARKAAEQQQAGAMNTEVAQNAGTASAMVSAEEGPTPERRNFLKEIKARLDAALDAE